MDNVVLFSPYQTLISSRCEQDYRVTVSLNTEIKSHRPAGLWRRIFGFGLLAWNHLLERPPFFSSVNLSSQQFDEAHRLEPA